MVRSVDVKFTPDDLNLLPPQADILRLLQNLLSKPQTKVDDVAFACLQDPVLTCLILQASISSPEHSSESLDMKILTLRIGFSNLRRLVDSLANNQKELDPKIEFLYEKRVKRLVRTGIISRIIAEGAAKHVAEEAPTLGVISKLAELIVMVKHPDEYLELSTSSTTSNFYLRFQKFFHRSVNSLNVSFLSCLRIPRAVIRILDSAESVSNDEMLLRNIVFSADEIIHAYETDKLSRYSPGAILPSKSHLRLLPFNDNIYSKTFERIVVFLHKKVQLEPAYEDAQNRNDTLTDNQNEVDFNHFENLDLDIASIEDQVSNLLGDQLFNDEPKKNELAVPDFSSTEQDSETKESLMKHTISAINSAKTFDQMYKALLSSLTENSLFDRAALAEVHADTRTLRIIEYSGEKFPSDVYELDSAIIGSLNLTKIKSSTIPSSIRLPLGSNTYACMPIPVGDKLFLVYADTKHKPIGLELRREFREVAERVLEKLKELDLESDGL